VSATDDSDAPPGRPVRDADVGLGKGPPASPGLLPALPLPAVAWSISTLGGMLVFAVILGRRNLTGSAMRVAGIGSPLGGVTRVPEGGHGTTALGPDGVPIPPDSATGGVAHNLGPTRSATRPAERFDRPPARGVERRIVSYQGVGVGDGLDGVRSVELGRLERGDEVEVLEWREGTVLVRTPGGLEGWVHGASIIGGQATDDA
jgi:hypothetical protein